MEKKMEVMEMPELVAMIEEPKDKEAFGKIEAMLTKFYPGHSRIQIENFILNDVEYPTAYGKYRQACVELYARYHKMVDIYYQIKEAEVRLEWRRMDAVNKSGFWGVHKDTEKSQLAALEVEKLQLQLASMKANFNHTLTEIRVFMDVYNANPEFHTMNQEQELELESEQWAKKLKNDPIVAEQRYGPEFMKRLWGDENFKAFASVRQKLYGPLPGDLTREIKPEPKLIFPERFKKEPKQIDTKQWK